MLLSVIIAWFTFAFLYTMSSSVVLKFEEGRYYGQGSGLGIELGYFIETICFVGAGIVFFVVFIYLIGQKFSYILEINQAIQQLEGGKLDYRLEVKGEDEISDLADSLNNMAERLEGYLQNEEKPTQERIELVQSLSHDIRTPLTAIISYTEFIKDHKYNDLEKLESYVSVIQSKAYQIKELTELLLDHNQGTLSPDERHIFDGKLLIKQLIEEYQETLEEEGFKRVQMYWDEKAFQTSLEPQDMVRIFDNLISNIIKYAELAEEVIFKIEVEQGFLTIRQTNKMRTQHPLGVESHGIGIKSIRQLADKYNGQLNIKESGMEYSIEIRLHI